jgi:hypothetical protein
MRHDWTGCSKEQHPALIGLTPCFSGRHVPALHPITSLISEDADEPLRLILTFGESSSITWNEACV